MPVEFPSELFVSEELVDKADGGEGPHERLWQAGGVILFWSRGGWLGPGHTEDLAKRVRGLEGLLLGLDWLVEHVVGVRLVVVELLVRLLLLLHRLLEHRGLVLVLVLVHWLLVLVLVLVRRVWVQGMLVLGRVLELGVVLLGRMLVQGTIGGKLGSLLWVTVMIARMAVYLIFLHLGHPGIFYHVGHRRAHRQIRFGVGVVFDGDEDAGKGEILSGVGAQEAIMMATPEALDGQGGGPHPPDIFVPDLKTEEGKLWGTDDKSPGLIEDRLEGFVGGHRGLEGFHVRADAQYGDDPVHLDLLL